METFGSDFSFWDWLHEDVERLFRAFWISSADPRIGFQRNQT